MIQFYSKPDIHYPISDSEYPISDSENQELVRGDNL
jgi:hypothetical protein